VDSSVGTTGLVEALGPAGRVYQKAEDYRRAVDDALGPQALLPRAADDAPVIEAALNEVTRDEVQARQVKRLRRELKRPVVELPFLYERNFGRSALNELCEELEEQLFGAVEEPQKAGAVG